MVLGGVSMAIANTSTNTLLQASAAAEVRGQAVSLFLLAMRGGIALGSLLTGAAVSLWGIRHALLLDGVLAIVVQLWIARSWLRGSCDTDALPQP